MLMKISLKVLPPSTMMYSYWADAFLKNKRRLSEVMCPICRGDLMPGKKCRPLLCATICFLITSGELSMSAKISTRQYVGSKLSMRAMSWLACKFKSTISARLPFKASAQARLTAMKVLPTPPLLLNTVMTLADMIFYLTTFFNFVTDDLDGEIAVSTKQSLFPRMLAPLG